jgi:hypothetical protein
MEKATYVDAPGTKETSMNMPWRLRKACVLRKAKERNENNKDCDKYNL